MKNYFNEGKQINRHTNDKLYKLFMKMKCNPNLVHDLSYEKSLPWIYKNILSLGLKFCVPSFPNFSLIEKSISECIRKLSWTIYFKCNENNTNYSDIDRIFTKIKKCNTKPDSKIHCEYEHEIFVDKNASKNITKKLKCKTHFNSLISNNLLSDLKQ